MVNIFLDGVLSVLLPLSSASRFQTLIVKNPDVVAFDDFKGILSLSASYKNIFQSFQSRNHIICLLSSKLTLAYPARY